MPASQSPIGSSMNLALGVGSYSPITIVIRLAEIELS